MKSDNLHAGLLQLVLWHASHITSLKSVIFMFLLHLPKLSNLVFSNLIPLHIPAETDLLLADLTFCEREGNIPQKSCFWVVMHEEICLKRESDPVGSMWELHVRRHNVIAHICSHPAAGETCQHSLLASISMDITHTVRKILKLLSLNVFNFTIVLKLCESVVVSAWDCLVPGWSMCR